MAVTRLEEFDLWRPGYGLSSVVVYIGGTTTLASLFLDENMTQPAANPQTLLQKTDDAGISYGKWQQPLYTGQPYSCVINSVDVTGVIAPPLTTLVGQDASQATVIPTNTVEAGNLDDILARRIDVRDFGPFLAIGVNNASATTNNAALQSALDAASGLGGGFVEVPAGTYAFTQLTIPGNVVLCGQGRLATTLQSTITGNVTTLGAANAGFAHLTLDGVNQNTGSVGVFGGNIDCPAFFDVQIQRFDIGLQRYGGTGARWKNLFVSDCYTAGYQAHGYSDNGLYGPITNETWDGGLVELCAGIGLDLQNIDSECSGLTFKSVGFLTNTGTAINVIGAQLIHFVDCWSTGNVTDLNIADGTGNTVDGSTQIITSFNWEGGSFLPQVAPAAASGSTPAVQAINGVIALAGTLREVAFRRAQISYTTININSPANNVLAEDCYEVPNTGITFGGNTPNAWTRHFTYNRGSSFVVTSGNSAAIAWAVTPEPGEGLYLEAKVVGRGRNTGNSGFFHLAVSARGRSAQLAYDLLTAQFTPGDIVTGQTSGATARIVGVLSATGSLTLSNVSGTFRDTEIISETSGGTTATVASIVGNVITFTGASGLFFEPSYQVQGQSSGATGIISQLVNTATSGTLYLQDITGDFLNNEIITDGNLGSASVNGVVSYQPCALLGSVTPLRPAQIENANSSMNATFAAAATQIQLQVTGDALIEYEWTVDVDVVSSAGTIN